MGQCPYVAEGATDASITGSAASSVWATAIPGTPGSDGSTASQVGPHPGTGEWI